MAGMQHTKLRRGELLLLRAVKRESKGQIRVPSPGMLHCPYIGDYRSIVQWTLLHCPI